MVRLLYNIRDKLNEITVKRSISANFSTLDLEREQELIASLKTNYLANLSSDPDYVDSDVGQQDLRGICVYPHHTNVRTANAGINAELRRGRPLGQKVPLPLVASAQGFYGIRTSQLVIVN